MKTRICLIYPVHDCGLRQRIVKSYLKRLLQDLLVFPALFLRAYTLPHLTEMVRNDFAFLSPTVLLLFRIPIFKQEYPKLAFLSSFGGLVIFPNFRQGWCILNFRKTLNSFLNVYVAS